MKKTSIRIYTNNTPDPEILIRTGNTIELAILIWQSIYSEIFVKNVRFYKKGFF